MFFEKNLHSDINYVWIDAFYGEGIVIKFYSIMTLEKGCFSFQNNENIAFTKIYFKNSDVPGKFFF